MTRINGLGGIYKDFVLHTLRLHAPLRYQIPRSGGKAGLQAMPDLRPEC